MYHTQSTVLTEPTARSNTVGVDGDAGVLDEMHNTCTKTLETRTRGSHFPFPYVLVTNTYLQRRSLLLTETTVWDPIMMSTKSYK